MKELRSLESSKIEKQELIKDFDKTEVKSFLKNYHNEKILEEIDLLKNNF